MRQYIRYSICIIAVCLIAYLWFGGLKPQTKGLVYSLFCDDLYAVVASGQLDITKQGATVRVPISAKYESAYNLYIVIPNKLNITTSTDQSGFVTGRFLGVRSQRDVYCSKKQYIFVGNPSTPEIGYDMEKTEIGLMSFTINKNLLDAENLELELEVVKPYLDFGVTEPVQFTVSSNFSL